MKPSGSCTIFLKAVGLKKAWYTILVININNIKKVNKVLENLLLRKTSKSCTENKLIMRFFFLTLNLISMWLVFTNEFFLL